MDALDQDRSVLVVAPTGSGKTLVADYAVARALFMERTAVYTTPLKALSNQKHRDLTARLGADRVGLITGDRVVNPGAPVLVMTTEVLRAMLYERGPSVDRLGTIVLDELHYLQDPDRGATWEEVVINAPRHTALVCLSATIPDPAVVHAWIETAHGPTSLVVAEARPVQLNHLYAVGNLHRTASLLLPMLVEGRTNKMAELLDGARRDTRGEGLRVRSRERPVTPTRAALLEHLHDNNLLPAIWFVLSRARCDDAAAACVADGTHLSTEAEVVAIRDRIEQALAGLDAGELRAIDVHQWRRLLEAGVAAHHGGMAPLQREVVEDLFAAGLVKVAFATETLALGVNLPARTVVIDRVARAGGELLSSGAFAQLAGRAGRRGIDEVGHVVVPWSPDVPFHQVAAMAGGQIAAISSQFRVRPALAANLVRGHDRAGAMDSVRSSLRHQMSLDAAAALESDLNARRAELAELDAELAAAPIAINDTVDAAVDDRTAIAAALARIRVGDVVADPGRQAMGAAVAVSVRHKRGETVVEAVRPDGRRLQLLASTFRSVPAIVGRIELPDWVRTERGHAKAAAAALAELELAPLLPTSKPAPRPSTSPDQRDRIVRAISALEAMVDDATSEVTDELAAMVRVLVRRGHVGEDWTLGPSGHVVRRLFHPAGLLVAESLVAGLLDDLDPPSLASAASWFTARSKLGAPQPSGFATQVLRHRWDDVRDLAHAVQLDEAAEGLKPTPHPEPALGVPIHRWAAGEPLDVALASAGVPIGDLVREARQVAELLEQLHDVPGAHQPAAREASEAIMRGAIVAADAVLSVGPWAR